jgi:transposase-like protein
MSRRRNPIHGQAKSLLVTIACFARAPPGIQVQTVAAALAIHPLILSKWRKDVKDVRLRGRPKKAPASAPAREIAQLQALERKYASYRRSMISQKQPSGSGALEQALEERPLRLHRPPHHAVRRPPRRSALSPLPRLARRVLCLAYAPSERSRQCAAQQDRELTAEVVRRFAVHH